MELPRYPLKVESGLLYIEDRDSGQARKRVLERLGIEA